MSYELTGVSIPMGGVQWQKTPGDREVARAATTFLEDRRLLFGDRHVEDEGHCVASALAIRTFMTEQITRAKPGRELEGSLRAVRAACRKFVDAGGPDGRDFVRAYSQYEAGGFGLALGDWRRVHADLYEPHLSSWGIQRIEDAEVVTEFFTVVFREPADR